MSDPASTLPDVTAHEISSGGGEQLARPVPQQLKPAAPATSEHPAAEPLAAAAEPLAAGRAAVPGPTSVGPVPAGAPADAGEPRPRSLDPQELGFTPRGPVPWLGPRLLAATAVRVVLAQLFGAYLDKRELQGALPEQTYDERGPEGDTGEVWFDYVADTGDGFDPTYSIAYLLAQPTLTPDGTPLPRGRMVVLGGDQVYPTPSGQQYEDRFKGPFRAAFPVPPREGEQPSIYALPGNHDWYDGLTAFLRLFARARHGHIGGWRTRQSRSYFAIQLPQRWWLFAIDSQFGAYIDDPQLRYFADAAKALSPGDRVILCTPSPDWVEATTHHDPQTYDSIDYFVRTVITPTGADVRAMISGDLHHYARYSGPARELITCGGGGAYLYATHRLPEKIEVPPQASLVRKPSPSQEYQLAARYPSKARSRSFAAGVFDRLPWRNPGFVGLLGVLHLMLMLSLANASSAMDKTAELANGIVQLRLVTIPILIMASVILITTIAFAAPRTGGHAKFKHWLLGTVHGFAHIGLGVLGAWLWMMVPLGGLPYPVPPLVALLVYAPLAGVAASLLFSGYLLFASMFGVNLNELFSAQGIIDAKGFLRLHVGRDGTLTIYPIAVDEVGRRWTPTPRAAPENPWFEPERPITVRLVEPPIQLR